MPKHDEDEWPIFKFTEDAGDYYAEHVDRICEQWGAPEAERFLLPDAGMDEDHAYRPTAVREAEIFGAAVRDARRYLEKHGYTFDPAEAGRDPDHDEYAKKEDATIAAALKRVEHQVRRRFGRLGDLEELRGFALWIVKQDKLAKAKAKRNDVIAKCIIAGGFAMLMGWCVFSCT